jgi:hypothetical protein
MWHSSIFGKFEEEIKRSMNSGNACCSSVQNPVQNLVYSHLPSNNVKIIIYKSKILPMVLYEYRCET